MGVMGKGLNTTSVRLTGKCLTTIQEHIPGLRERFILIILLHNPEA